MPYPLTAPGAALLLLALPEAAPAQEAAPALIRPARVMTVINESTALRRRYPAAVQPSQEAVISLRLPGPVMVPAVLGGLATVPLLWGPFFQPLAVAIDRGLGVASIPTLIAVATLGAIFIALSQSKGASDAGPG